VMGYRQAGKPTDFDSVIRRFESYYPIQFSKLEFSDAEPGLISWLFCFVTASKSKGFLKFTAIASDPEQSP